MHLAVVVPRLVGRGHGQGALEDLVGHRVGALVVPDARHGDGHGAGVGRGRVGQLVVDALGERLAVVGDNRLLLLGAAVVHHVVGRGDVQHVLLRAVGLVRVDRLGRGDGLGGDGQAAEAGGVDAVVGLERGAVPLELVLAEHGGQAGGGRRAHLGGQRHGEGLALHEAGDDLNAVGAGLLVEELGHGVHLAVVVPRLVGRGHGQGGRGDLNRHIFCREIRIACAGRLGAHGHGAVGDVLHARGRGRPLAFTNLVVDGVAIGGRIQRSGSEVILGIVGPGAARQGELSALRSGGLDLEIALVHSHDVVAVGGVVDIQHVLVGAYGLIFVCALIGHGSKIVVVHKPLYGASKGGIFLIKELFGAVHRDGGRALSNLEIVLRRQFRQVIGGGPCGLHLVRAGIGGLGADPFAVDEIGVGRRAVK